MPKGVSPRWNGSRPAIARPPRNVWTSSASIGGTAASLQSEQTARANADSVLAQRIDTVQASTDTNSSDPDHLPGGHLAGWQRQGDV